MQIASLTPRAIKRIKKYGLNIKFAKARKLFESDIHHPSLNTERLEPKEFSIYSFRIDRKYRAHFFIVSGKAEVFDVTLHYQ